jgi:hypothetical protein
VIQSALFKPGHLRKHEKRHLRVNTVKHVTGANHYVNVILFEATWYPNPHHSTVVKRWQASDAIHLFYLQLCLYAKRQAKGRMTQLISHTCMVRATYFLLSPKYNPATMAQAPDVFSIWQKCKTRICIGLAALLLEDAAHGAVTMNMPDCFCYKVCHWKHR